jgi:hypothetical protein
MRNLPDTGRRALPTAATLPGGYYRSEKQPSCGSDTMPRALTFALLAVLAAAEAGAQGVPFAPGESCTYRGSSRLGRIGTGTMAVEAGGTVEGRSTYLLRFDFAGRVGIFGIQDRSRSWFDPATVASYRYTKRERSPVASRDEDVRMLMSARRWEGSEGEGGALGSDRPLDELSFIYFMRTLRLADGDAYSLARHFDPSRNPVRVRVLGRGTMQVPAGTFRTVHVEMRVRDPHRYRGEGVIQLHLTDDDARIPVRIESNIPQAGRMVLSLESGRGACDAARLARAD